MMVEAKKSEILLESGTNEVEILEFTIAGRHFGINVSKVVELMPQFDVTPMPNANPYIEGVFKPREETMTLINLASYMGLSDNDDGKHIYIVTNFNKQKSAFHVHGVEAIHRISWSSIEKPDPSIYGGRDGLATGIARIDGRLVAIIDFEKILADINPEAAIQMINVDKLGERPATDKPIILAEDSMTAEKSILEAFDRAGFTNITVCSNGLEAWELLQSFKGSGRPLKDHVACVIADIEMPKMDGHRLCKLIREDLELKALPVVIFSSLISPEMEVKGKAVGATAQMAKPEIAQLIKIIDQYML